jgi:hypothetical protein
MIVKHSQASYETYVNAGTNFDGHTFTASDIGRHTVQVQFGSAVTTYQIEVTSGHTLNYVEASEATNWSNGSAAHYECTECGKLFSDAGAQNEITLDSIKTSNGAWAHFTNYKGINGDVASAEYVNVNDKIFDEDTIVRATKVRLNKDLNAGGQFDHQNNFDDPAVADRTNTRIPFVPGQKLDLKFYYENTGTSAISFKYRLWDGQPSTEIVEFSLQPGESTVISVTFTNPANLNNEGGWARFIAQSNIAAGAEFISYAFYSTTNHGIFDFTGTGTGHKATLGIKQNATKTTFKVGETFTTDDLVLLLKNSLPNQKHGGILLFHFDTNFDNHVFTSDDIGTQKVVVRFADASVTYNIRVEA